ncbi:MAG: hypothetical protein ABJC87_00880 [Roseobacter sp.]
MAFLAHTVLSTPSWLSAVGARIAAIRGIAEKRWQANSHVAEKPPFAGAASIRSRSTICSCEASKVARAVIEIWPTRKLVASLAHWLTRSMMVSDSSMRLR